MNKKRIEQFIADKFDIPLDGICDIPSAEIKGNSMLNIDGCTGIKKYETDEIIIRSREYLLRINGESLSMLTFSLGRVSIRGKILSYSIEVL